MDGEEDATSFSQHERNFLDLPAEIIEQILTLNAVNFRDVISTMKVCTHLRNIGMSNELWRHKHRQRWPALTDKFDIKKSWYEEFRVCYTLGLDVYSLVDGMSSKYYKCAGVSRSHFADFLDLLKKHGGAAAIAINQLLIILNDEDREESLTVKYYAEKVLRFLHQTTLTKQVKDFLALPADKQSLEIGAILVAQWCQPKEDVRMKEICSKLDSLAVEVKNEVCKSFPTHPLVNQSIKEPVVLDYGCEQSKHVLETLNRVLFEVHKFSGNSQNYYTQNNSFIDKVLKTKTGIPISLSILYMSIARRLGIICEPVNYPRHFLLRWKHRPHLPPQQMYTYIDVFNGGKFLSGDLLNREFNVEFDRVLQAAPTTSVMCRMLRNLIMIARQQGQRSQGILCLYDAVSLHQIMMPRDLNIMVLFAEVSVFLNIYVDDVLHGLNTVGSMVDPNDANLAEAAYWAMRSQETLDDNIEQERKQLVPKTRKTPEDALYSVGLIMRHKRYNYTCVIYGWDEKCKASADWIEQMGVHRLPHRDEQPFYHVLVEDGSNRYAAEESLEISNHPRAITHPQVGKYFTSFNGRYYLTNQENTDEHPEDAQMTSVLASQHYS